MNIESRFMEILQIKDRQEEAVAIRRLMDDLASGALGSASDVYAHTLGDQHLPDHPALAIECYYLSQYLNLKAYREGKTTPAHDINQSVYCAFTLKLEKKYGVFFYGKHTKR